MYVIQTQLSGHVYVKLLTQVNYILRRLQSKPILFDTSSTSKDIYNARETRKKRGWALQFQHISQQFFTSYFSEATAVS